MKTNSPQEWIESVSREDKKILQKNLLFVILFLILFGAIFFFIVRSIFFGQSPLAGTALYFGGAVVFFIAMVALYLLYYYTRSVFATEKIVKQGMVTAKRIDLGTSISKRNPDETNYFISLGSNEIKVGAGDYYKVSTGDEVALHFTRNNNYLFKTEILSSSLPAHNESGFLYEDEMTVEERAVVKSKLMSALFWRVLIAGISFFFISQLLMVIAVLIFVKNNTPRQQNEAMLYSIALVLLLLYYLINRRTIHLFKDLRSNKKSVEADTITDKENSNKLQALGNYAGIVYTINNGFIMADEANLEKAFPGGKIHVARAVHSKILLSSSVV